MKLRLLTILSLLSLLLCLATAIMWARSYWRSDTLGFQDVTSIVNTAAEAEQTKQPLSSVIPPERPVSRQQHSIRAIRSSHGGLVLLSVQYSAEALNPKAAPIDSIPGRAGAPGVVNRSSHAWACSWRAVTYPHWPDVASTPSAIMRSDDNRAATDLERLIADQQSRSKPPMRRGFGYAHWNHAGAEGRGRFARQLTLDARGFVLPYWPLCVLLLIAPSAALLHWRRRGQKLNAQWLKAIWNATFATAALLSLLLWLTAGTLWFRSHWRRDFFSGTGGLRVLGDELTPPRPEILPPWNTSRPVIIVALTRFFQFELETTPKGLVWSWYAQEDDRRDALEGWADPTQPTMTVRWGSGSMPQTKTAGLPPQWRPASLLGFEYCYQRAPDQLPTSPPLPSARSKNTTSAHAGLAIPWWSFMVLLAVMPTLFARRLIHLYRQKHRAQHGLCPHCAYDLRASTARCPECGQPIHSPVASNPR